MSNPECAAPCPAEAHAASVYSSIAVEDDELVCRGAYEPHHYNRSGNLRPSLIDRKSLEAGELSVWRCVNDNELPRLADKLVGAFDREGRTLQELYIVKGRELRELHSADDHRRAFSLLNDTRVDVHGLSDPLHAAVAPCRRLYIDGKIGPETMEQLVNLLFLQYRQRPPWKCAG